MASEGKNLVGVDIGTSSIKVAEIKEGRKGKRTLVRFGFHPCFSSSANERAVSMRATLPLVGSLAPLFHAS